MEERTDTWTEADSRDFMDLAEIAVPAREEQTQALLDLIPAERSETFTVTDICAGEGLLCERILNGFPNSRVVALDGSELMRAKAAARLAAFGERAVVRAFALDADDWFDDVPSPLRCAVSSMALHHLEAQRKRDLFLHLAKRLEPGGALIIADITATSSEFVRRSFAEQWEKLAREQSQATTGSLDGYKRAVMEGWRPTWLTEAELGEMPYPVFQQLKWLEEAGLSTVDCFWMRAGHAVYGGYK
jgi:trans-aconitate methyltransferase